MVFPGRDPELGASGPSGLAHRVWNGIWGGGSNVDVHIDLRESSALPSLIRKTMDASARMH